MNLATGSRNAINVSLVYDLLKLNYDQIPCEFHTFYKDVIS